MRVLFAVLSPISTELGASQMALNLANALRTQGIETVVWTPHPVPPEIPWWRRMAWVRRAVAEYVRRDGAFDAVDVPPVAVTRSLAKQCAVVARSVQPDLAYLWTEVRFAGRARPVRMVVWIGSALFNLYLAGLVVCGWCRARHILCLGSSEFEWMKRWFPWWRRKLGMYVNATGDDERQALGEIRQDREPPSRHGVRFLWLGRWAAHKGVDLLLEFIHQRLAKYPDDRVTIAGCGPGVERCVSSLLLQEGKIRIVPSYDRRGLMDLLGTHDAGLFTSRVEGWGLTLQEMLESGLPVYATRTGAVTDLQAEFPDLLREFPPSAADRVTVPGVSRERREYFERFSWRMIAAGYLEAVRARV